MVDYLERIEVMLEEMLIHGLETGAREPGEEVVGVLKLPVGWREWGAWVCEKSQVNVVRLVRVPEPEIVSRRPELMDQVVPVSIEQLVVKNRP